MSERDEHVFHLTPRNDMREHADSGATRDRCACWCQPVRRVEGDGVVWVHNSMDGRELVEEHGVN
jgi:hypothetical protein